MEKTYKFLGIAATIFKVLAWISLALGIISSLVILIGGGTPEAPRTTGIIGLLLGLVYFFIAFTASEVITLLLDLKNKLEKGQN